MFSESMHGCGVGVGNCNMCRYFWKEKGKGFDVQRKM